MLFLCSLDWITGTRALRIVAVINVWELTFRVSVILSLETIRVYDFWWHGKTILLEGLPHRRLDAIIVDCVLSKGLHIVLLVRAIVQRVLVGVVDSLWLEVTLLSNLLMKVFKLWLEKHVVLAHLRGVVEGGDSWHFAGVRVEVLLVLPLSVEVNVVGLLLLLDGLDELLLVNVQEEINDWVPREVSQRTTHNAVFNLQEGNGLFVFES